MLDRAQHILAHRTGAQRGGQRIGGSDRILNGEVDPDTADRRHRMGGIADQQQARPVPALEPVDPHLQKLHRIPVGDLADAVAVQRLDRGDRRAQMLDPLRLQLFQRPFRNDIGALPIIPAVDRDHDRAGIEKAKAFFRVAVLALEPEPQHVHRRAEIIDSEACALAHHRMAAIAGDNEARAHRDVALGRGRAHAGDRAVLLDQVSALGLHHQMEGGEALRLLGQKIEEVPLRHQRDIGAMHREVAEVADRDRLAADDRPQGLNLLVRQLEEFRENF